MSLIFVTGSTNHAKERWFVLLIVLLCFCLSHAAAQTVTLTDVNFRNCLRETYPAAFNASGELILAEAKNIKNIHCEVKGIQSIAGLGYFENVETINFNTNDIQSIPDITGLHKLISIIVQNNRLSAVPDLSGNPQLESLDLAGNQITLFPDITNNPKLSWISFNTNLIQVVPDLSAYTSLVLLAMGSNPVHSLPDLSANTALYHLEISATNLSSFPDLSKNVNLKYIGFGSNPQFNVFPDFSLNPKLAVIICSYNNLTSIPDLSAFTDLERVDCNGNKLTALPDLSKNKKLKWLRCDDNKLTQLPDLSQCPLLERLDCRSNNLTSLPDVGSNLEQLVCFGNKLTSIPDLSKTKLGQVEETILNISDNRLTFEDILQGAAIQNLDSLAYTPQAKIGEDTNVTLLPMGNPFVIDLNIDDTVTSNVYRWYKDDQLIDTNNSSVFRIEHTLPPDEGIYRATISNPNAPDLVLQTGSTTLTMNLLLYNIPDDNFEACLKETHPEVFNSDGYVMIDKAKSVSSISCPRRGITSVSGITLFDHAISIYLEGNKLSDYPKQVSANQILHMLSLDNNAFTSFPDLTSYAGSLSDITITGNQLTEIPDLSAFNLHSLFVGKNPLKKFPSLSENKDLLILSIQDVDLETFPDLSANTKLRDLEFDDNPQFSQWPDLSKNTILATITCRGNGISSIPSLSLNPLLHELDFSYNHLTTLPDVSGLQDLRMLNCSNNELHSLPDLSGTKLGKADSHLNVSANHLTFEDLVPVVKSKVYAALKYDHQTIPAVNQAIIKDKGQSYVIDINIDDAVAGNSYKWFKDGILLTTSGSNSLSLTSLEEGNSGVYTCAISNPDVPGLEILWEKVTLTVNTLIPPWVPVAGGFDNHLILVPNDVITDIYGVAIQTGDYIGVFFKDDNHALKPGASIRWTGESNTITAWGSSEQGAKNGFASGEEMTFMIWKAAEKKTYTVVAVFDTQIPYTDQGNFRANGFSRIKSLNAPLVCHTINLQLGWNLISTYVRATDVSMASIFGNKQGILVKDASGKIQYAPEFSITNGTWNIGEGYMIFSSASQSFEVCGQPINSDTPVSLVRNSYPAFLPYYGDIAFPVKEALKGLGTSYSYVQTIDYVPGSDQAVAYNYIPAHIVNPPIDQIGNMKPGLAYKVLLQNNVTSFRYPAGVSSTSGRLKDREEPFTFADHFRVIQQHLLNNSVLVIPADILADRLSAGDEIAVLDHRGNVIGASSYQGSALAITIWESEGLDIFTVRLWEKQTGKEYGVELSYANGEGKFVADRLLIVNSAQISGELESGNLVKVFPNPAVRDLQISFSLSQESHVRMLLFDMMGKEQGELFNSTFGEGAYQEAIDLSAFPSGFYTYQVWMNERIVSGKILISK